MFIFLEAFSDPFVAAVETASQSSLGTRAKLHKVEAAEEGLLLGETAEYAANSSTHDASFVSTTSNPSNTQIFLKRDGPRSFTTGDEAGGKRTGAANDGADGVALGADGASRGLLFFVGGALRT
jgi:hypothetical protein